ncbi:Sucrase/ferredoxin-like-domain-containing protein [Lactarius akahatsu]|uniref:Sucrase/ferredoxin-like-domain-containing protein n=1 Tax=Lactarius akahatsu TaxID=416441 RepID=A0AAD4LQE5_9AGAM|nr:Sucrase/ferredoxin-like-domain-containing protein [Lactarius akahatsu]
MKAASLRTINKLSSSAARTDFLAGTVPLHQAYILLHGRDSPRSFPSRVTSPLLVALRQYALRWSALVNVAWVPPLLTFAHGRAGLQIPSVTMDNLDEVCSRLHDYMERPPTGAVDLDDLYLYVCTHGARDCRCGEWGSKVADALRNEIHWRKGIEPTGKYSRVVVGEVGHVGGHQYAANMLVFPYGEWLGGLRPDNVPGVLDVIMEQSSPVDLARTSLLPTHWRGRMGLARDQQLQRFLLHRDNSTV